MGQGHHLSRREILNSIRALGSGSLLLPLSALQGERQNTQAPAVIRGALRDGATGKPRDKAILLTEWLGYGVERVPRLYEELRDGRMRGTFDPREVAEGKTQQPALFDFARQL